jgi:hypothetical protein
MIAGLVLAWEVVREGTRDSWHPNIAYLIRMSDKLPAPVILARHLGMYLDQRGVQGKEGRGQGGGPEPTAC